MVQQIHLLTKEGMNKVRLYFPKHLKQWDKISHMRVISDLDSTQFNRAFINPPPKRSYCQFILGRCMLKFHQRKMLETMYRLFSPMRVKKINIERNSKINRFVQPLPLSIDLLDSLV
jgi:hypothetical protein